MHDRPPAGDGQRAEIAVTGMAVVSGLGRGTAAQLTAALTGRPNFRPVRRFDVSRRRAGLAATLDDAVSTTEELISVTDQACATARMTARLRGTSPLLLAAHADPALTRSSEHPAGRAGAAGMAVTVADRCGLARPLRTYTTGCVAASTAVIDAALMIVEGRAERVVVAAGYLVDQDYFAVFDAGRALAASGAVRPFSVTRDGMLLGDAVAAVVLESPTAAVARGAVEVARLVGWGRAGDGYHVCQPHPTGGGLAKAIQHALRRARVEPAEIGYLSANATGTVQSDAAETAGLYAALGGAAADIPVSSTKSIHGHTLEASGLLELIIAVLALGHGRLPVNAGFVGPDPGCRLNLVLDEVPPTGRYALSVNAAFGGANTALLATTGAG